MNHCLNLDLRPANGTAEIILVPCREQIPANDPWTTTGDWQLHAIHTNKPINTIHTVDVRPRNNNSSGAACTEKYPLFWHVCPVMRDQTPTVSKKNRTHQQCRCNGFSSLLTRVSTVSLVARYLVRESHRKTSRRQWYFMSCYFCTAYLNYTVPCMLSPILFLELSV